MSETDGCDGALWGIVVKETKEEVVKEVLEIYAGDVPDVYDLQSCSTDSTASSKDTHSK